MRADKLLCEMNIGSRSQVRALIKKGLVFADGVPVPKPETQVDEKKVRITCRGKEYRYRPMVYYMLNKPSGVVTATWDKHERTVLDLLKEYLQAPEGGGVPKLRLEDHQGLQGLHQTALAGNAEFAGKVAVNTGDGFHGEFLRHDGPPFSLPLYTSGAEKGRPVFRRTSRGALFRGNGHLNR